MGQLGKIQVTKVEHYMGILGECQKYKDPGDRVCLCVCEEQQRQYCGYDR